MNFNILTVMVTVVTVTVLDQSSSITQLEAVYIQVQLSAIVWRASILEQRWGV